MVKTTKPFSFPYSRFIGFDHVWNEIERLSSIAGANEKGFPRHNVVKVDKNLYQLELALAGYGKDQLSVEVKPGLIVVTGKAQEGGESPQREYLYQGITRRSFVETFRIGEHVVADGAAFKDGVLVIKLREELPEDQRPAYLEIKTGDAKDENLSTTG